MVTVCDVPLSPPVDVGVVCVKLAVLLTVSVVVTLTTICSVAELLSFGAPRSGMVQVTVVPPELDVAVVKLPADADAETKESPAASGSVTTS